MSQDLTLLNTSQLRKFLRTGIYEQPIISFTGTLVLSGASTLTFNKGVLSSLKLKSNRTDLFIIFLELDSDLNYIIDDELKTIDVTVPSGTNVTNLVATLTTFSDLTSIKVGSVNQESGVTENNFSSPVTYTVVAENGVTTSEWLVTVTIA